MSAKGSQDTYQSLKELVRTIYFSAPKERGLNIYQAFAYTYDEVEGIFSRGKFQNLCLLVALFVFVEASNLALNKEDPFTQDVIDELKTALKAFDSNQTSSELDKRYRDEELSKDIDFLKSIYES
ncbi:hypothetical protein ACI2S5_26405 [Ralstonia nicotianae]|uniref:Uncharacterized protein n=1 Tax=Ralstonia solanacearum TaxID=305 RepID=A0A0S4UC74_RALSL|nr:hypothetical protein [Ralstonia pseudosolanacearum]NKA06551.1 hypothetical protein [Ralstonia solanacearum]MCK4130643.1 hypothetical protein [Ralstonia pseudosolanacearum]MDO3518693.1 hypothetical protein [Ralstonia pseudosolanacearum]MDO3544775.1 hypothetical protein [Ralstonia pseudosolanacearum]NKA37046.1 hypothetical protein [Ralstonia solanacearum]